MKDFLPRLRRFPILILCAAFLLGIALTTVYFSLLRAQPSTPSAAVDVFEHDTKMNTCIDRVIEISKPPKMSLGMYEEIWRLCGNQLFNGLYLTDFGIRKEKFIRQELDERVNLWLVVAITLSGVVLAGIQLFLSYRLAIQGIGEFAKDSELAIQSRRISLRSSVTGAIILCLSLIFFMVYVYWIYSIREVPVERPQNLLESSESEPTQVENRRPAASREKPSPDNDATKKGSNADSGGERGP